MRSADGEDMADAKTAKISDNRVVKVAAVSDHKRFQKCCSILRIGAIDSRRYFFTENIKSIYGGITAILKQGTFADVRANQDSIGKIDAARMIAVNAFFKRVKQRDGTHKIARS